ncbi:hypothetical protein EHM82_02070, partial [bacterium]
MTLKALFVVFLLPIPAIAQTVAPPGASSCEALFAAQPDREEPAKCLFDLSREPDERERAASRLRALQRAHSDNPWLALYTGHVDSDRSEELYRQAARGFAHRREARGEVLAHSNLQRLLFAQGRLEEAGAEAELATQVAQASGDPALIARGRIVLARHLHFASKDLEKAYLLLRQAETALFPEGDYSLQRDCLLNLGNISLELGRYREGTEVFRRLAEVAAANEDRFTEANAKFGLASAIVERAHELPQEGELREAARLTREALDAAIAAGHRGIEAKAHYLLGTLSSGEEARRHFEACLVAADAVRDRSFCLNGLARELSASDPRKAQETINQSLELARQAEDYWAMALAWRERMRVSWVAGPPDRAMKDSESALDAIEALRDLQTSSSSQAGMFSTWLEDYYWFHGRLLDGREKDGPGDLERAFLVAERMRARTLIDTLQAARAVPASDPLRQRRAAVLERISGIQRRLLDPDLPASERPSASRELERLEIEHADLHNQLNRAAPSLANLSRPDFASLAQVRQTLSPREALLSFQIAPWEDMQKDFAGG